MKGKHRAIGLAAPSRLPTGRRGLFYARAPRGWEGFTE